MKGFNKKCLLFVVLIATLLTTIACNQKENTSVNLIDNDENNKMKRWLEKT